MTKGIAFPAKSINYCFKTSTFLMFNVVRLEHSHSFTPLVLITIPLRQDPLGVDVAGLLGMQ